MTEDLRRFSGPIDLWAIDRAPPAEVAGSSRAAQAPPAPRCHAARVTDCRIRAAFYRAWVREPLDKAFAEFLRPSEGAAQPPRCIDGASCPPGCPRTQAMTLGRQGPPRPKWGRGAVDLCPDCARNCYRHRQPKRSATDGSPLHHRITPRLLLNTRAVQRRSLGTLGHDSEKPGS